MRSGPFASRNERRELEAELAALPTLAECGPREVQQLAAAGTAVRLPAGWSVIAEGTPGDTCYLLLAGEMTVTVGGNQVATLSQGALFGEVGLLDHRLRGATVTCVSQVRVLSMSYAALEPLLGREPHLADALLADYRRRSSARE